MAFGERCLNFFVAGANFTFALGGLALIITGVLSKLNISDYTNAIPTDYQSISLAPTLTIVVGVIVFVIAFFGCCGAIRESPCLLTTYSVILLVIFLLQIAVGIFAFVEIKNEADFRDHVKKSLTVLFNKYNNNKNDSNAELVNLIQQEYKCCGIDDSSSWNDNIPLSCHEDKDAAKRIFKAGCVDEFFNSLTHSIKVIGIVVLALSSLEVVGSIFSLCLSSSIRNRERRFRY